MERPFLCETELGKALNGSGKEGRKAFVCGCLNRSVFVTTE